MNNVFHGITLIKFSKLHADVLVYSSYKTKETYRSPLIHSITFTRYIHQPTSEESWLWKKRFDILLIIILKPVSLMESLDSTLETKRPAAALSLLSQQKKQQQVVASPDGKKSTCISFLWEESNYTCKRFWKYKNLIVNFSFLKRARQTFKVSRRLISFNLQRGGGGGGWSNFCLWSV